MAAKREKSPQVRQAQIAAFIAERVGDYKDKNHIFGIIGHLATAAAADVVRVTEKDEFIRSAATGGRTKVPAGSEHVVATADDYYDFVKSAGGASHEMIQGRATLLEAYQDFAPLVASLKDTLHADAQGAVLLGRGSNSAVYEIEKDGRHYAVRLPQRADTGVSIDAHMTSAIMAKDLPHIERIVAASYEDGVTVAEVMPGKELDKLSLDAMRQITDKQLGDFVDTLLATRAHGLQVDPSKASNFFYDPEEGFGIVDIYPEDKNGAREPLSVGQVVAWGAYLVGGIGSEQSKTTIDDYRYDRELLQMRQGLMARYQVATAGKLDGADKTQVFEVIQKNAAYIAEQIANYDNPEWVAVDLAVHEARNRSLAERSVTLGSGWGSA